MYKRPVIIFGAGSYLDDWHLEILEEKQVPFLLTWAVIDKVPSSHALNCGGFGVAGSRVGNLMVQNADILYVVGASLDQMQTGDPKDFAKNAEKVYKFIDQRDEFDTTNWLKTINNWKSEYPVVTRKDYLSKTTVSPYAFMAELSDYMKEGDILTTDAGANLTWTMQGIKTKKNQRVFSAWKNSPMGYSLPAAIGATFAAPSRRVSCIIGDGGLMMCLQELSTISRHKLPIKIFLFNNQGHGIQKQTAETWLFGRYHGMDYESGIAFPDYNLLAMSFGIHYTSIKNNDELFHINNVLNSDVPILCDVNIDKNARIVPFLKSGQKLEEI